MIFWALMGLVMLIVGGVLANVYTDRWGNCNGFWSVMAVIGFVVMVVNLLRFAWAYLP